jgi:hypothetical protein
MLKSFYNYIRPKNISMYPNEKYYDYIVVNKLMLPLLESILTRDAQEISTRIVLSLSSLPNKAFISSTRSSFEITSSDISNESIALSFQ